MTIKEKTAELGEMIRETEEYNRFKEAERVQSEDETAQELLKEYNLKRMNLARDMHNGVITEDEAMAQSRKDFEALLENAVIGAYVDAKNAFDAVVNEINDTLNYYITGVEPGCTHNCGTCGGCG